MNLRRFAGICFLLPIIASAQSAIKPCDDLKAEIGRKLDAKGVTGYELVIADKGKEPDGRTVGTCSAGTRVIVYRRKAAPGPQPRPMKQPGRR